MKIPLCHINVHQKATSAEKDFSNQVDTITHSVWSQPLSQAIAVIAPWTRVNVAMLSEIWVVQAKNTWASTHQG